MPTYYTLRMFEGNEEVATSPVAVVPNSQLYPAVGETVSNLWIVTQVLESPEGEYHVRVEPLAKGASSR